MTEAVNRVQSVPKVSIGLPVYNGENYLEEALDSILAQTFTDFELIISDNASTDRTEEICRAYVARDDRVQYLRNATNRGAAWNYNRLVDVAQGEYFKWAAHDDLIAPEFLARCVEVLDRDPSAVGSYPLQRTIDKDGKVLREHESADYGAAEPHKRFFQCVCRPFPNSGVFGLIRTKTLRRTIRIGSFSAADRVLMGELVLLGRFEEIPEYMFFKRDHPDAHWRANRDRRDRERWYDPSWSGKTPRRTFRLFREHVASIWRVPLEWRERAWCHIYMLYWIRRKWRKLAKDLRPRRG